MRKYGLLFLGIGVVIASVGPLPAADDDVLKEAMKKSEGNWQIVSRVVDGQQTPEGDLKGHRMVLKDGKWTSYKGKEVVGAGTYRDRS
jgi:hypothetical protein